MVRGALEQEPWKEAAKMVQSGDAEAEPGQGE